MNSTWADTISAATHTPVAVLVAAVCIYLVLVAIVAVVASLHPDAGRREDARKVLDLLLTAARPGRRR